MGLHPKQSLELIPDGSAALGTPSFTAGNTKSTEMRFIPSWWASCGRALEGRVSKLLHSASHPSSVLKA